MTRRSAAPLLAALLLTTGAALAACTDEDTSPAPRNPTSSTSSAPVDDGVLQLAEAQLRVGPPEIVMGPSTYVDSIVNAVEVDGKVRAYVGRGDTLLLEGSDVTDLAPTDDLALHRGGREDFDRCGAWLDAVVQDGRDPDLLRGWYHAETDCIYHANQTRKSIAYAESRDGGRTFTKPGYPDNQVLRSPTPVVDGARTGRGDFSIVRRGPFYYLYFLDVTADLKTRTAVARAPVRSGGVPGSWHTYTEDETGVGSWTSPGVDGEATPLRTRLPAASASVDRASGEVMLARQNTPSGGIVLQASEDGLHFHRLPEPVVPYLPSQVRTDWGAVDDKQIFGYVSVMAEDGSREWEDSFYLFHMYVFPGEDLHDGRYLVRRKVTVVEAPEEGPWSTVAITTYDGGGTAAGGDRFETSAPVKPEDATARSVTASALSTPGPDRRPLTECTSEQGDRYLSGACAATATEGRLVGYAFREEQPGTVALYRCADGRSGQFATLDAGCEGGRQVAELGYVYPPA